MSAFSFLPLLYQLSMLRRYGLGIDSSSIYQLFNQPLAARDIYINLP